MNMICEFINKAAVKIVFRNETKNYTQLKQIKGKKLSSSVFASN